MERNLTIQLPEPPERVIVQFSSAPVIVTMPVGVVSAVTVTETDHIGVDRSRMGRACPTVIRVTVFSFGGVIEMDQQQGAGNSQR
jgi:hypothetical protein